MDAGDVFPDGTEVTGLLGKWQSGDQAAGDRLLDLVYEYMLNHASRLAARFDSESTTRDVANSAVVRFMEGTAIPATNRSHLLGYIAQAMKNLHRKHWRDGRRLKRGGGVDLVELPSGLTVKSNDGTDALAVVQALERLESDNADQATIVSMRFYADMTWEEIGVATGTSARSVKREWLKARKKLLDLLDGSPLLAADPA